jgi:hypothetical protein
MYTSATNQQLEHYLTLLVENGSWRFDGKGFTIEGKEEKRKKRSRYDYELRICSLVSEKTHKGQNYFLFENVDRGADRRSRNCSLWSV